METIEEIIAALRELDDCEFCETSPDHWADRIAEAYKTIERNRSVEIVNACARLENRVANEKKRILAALKPVLECDVDSDDVTAPMVCDAVREAKRIFNECGVV